jgi:hypothetical protein
VARRPPVSTDGLADLRLPYDGSQADYTADYYHHGGRAARIIRAGLPTQLHRLDETSLATPFQGSDDESSGHTLTISADTSVGEFKSITAYREVEANAYNDFSGNTFLTIYRNDLFYMTPAPVLQELQWFGKTRRKRLDWVFGLITSTSRAARSRPIIPLRFDSARHLGRKHVVRGVRAGDLSHVEGFAVELTPAAATPRTSATRAITFWSRRLAKTATSRQLMIEYRLSDARLLYGKIVTGYAGGHMRQADFDSSFAPRS